MSDDPVTAEWLISIGAKKLVSQWPAFDTGLGWIIEWRAAGWWTVPHDLPVCLTDTKDEVLMLLAALKIDHQ